MSKKPPTPLDELRGWIVAKDAEVEALERKAHLLRIEVRERLVNEVMLGAMEREDKANAAAG